MNKQVLKTIIWITIFSIAMAFMEAAVVIYLRALYYPGGFEFPLKIIDHNIAFVEFFREIATIVMLAGIGIMAGKNNIKRFAFFIFSFAVWDIFYYVFLKIILNWPGSFFTWDILFMVPVTWVGPVIAPIINSLTMISLAGCIIFFVNSKGFAKIGVTEWALLIAGSVVIIFSYTEEYLFYMLEKFSFCEIFGISEKEEVFNYACTFIPKYFNWYIFSVGELILLSAIFIFYKKMKKKSLL